MLWWITLFITLATSHQLWRAPVSSRLNETSVRSLRNLDDLGIGFDLPRRPGWNEDALYEDLVDRLKGGGLSKVRRRDGESLLMVLVDYTAVENDRAFVVVRLELIQYAFLFRDPSVKALARTWSEFDIIKGSVDFWEIRRTVGLMTDHFVRDWKEANP